MSSERTTKENLFYNSLKYKAILNKLKNKINLLELSKRTGNSKYYLFHKPMSILGELKKNNLITLDKKGREWEIKRKDIVDRIFDHIDTFKEELPHIKTKLNREHKQKISYEIEEMKKLNGNLDLQKLQIKNIKEYIFAENISNFYEHESIQNFIIDCLKNEYHENIQEYGLEFLSSIFTDIIERHDTKTFDRWFLLTYEHLRNIIMDYSKSLSIRHQTYNICLQKLLCCPNQSMRKYEIVDWFLKIMIENKNDRNKFILYHYFDELHKYYDPSKMKKKLIEIMDSEKTDDELRRHIIDFLSGSPYINIL